MTTPSFVMTVKVMDVTDRMATCRDTHGGTTKVRTDIQRAKGIEPLPGETWVIDKSLGLWSFAAIVGAPLTSGIGGGGVAQTFVNQQWIVADPPLRSYTLSAEPILSSETVALNGINLDPGAGDYLITGTNLSIRAVVNLVATDVLSIRYAKAV